MQNGKITLLLVDPDPVAAWEVGRRLTREGYAVTVCADGAEAMSLATEKPFGVVITEVHLPRISGLSLADWMRENRPSTVTIVLTKSGSPALRQAVESKGTVGYLEKPLDFELLRSVLAQHPSNETFRGTIEQIDILDYLQLMMLSGKQAVLEVISVDGRRGELFIEKGEVRHALCGGFEGEEAVYECLAFQSGTFRNHPWRDPERITVDKPGEFLLIEAARKRDDMRVIPPAQIN